MTPDNEPVTQLEHTATRVQWPVCDSCSVGLANDDWSHIDALPPDEAEEEHARVLSSVELLGFVVHIGAYDPGGYWRCEVCDDTCIGSGHVWEGDRRAG